MCNNLAMNMVALIESVFLADSLFTPDWRWALAALGLGVCGYLLYVAVRWLVWYARRYIGMRTFHEVKPGVLYRCGQLHRDHLQKVKDQFGIRTVVCLRASVEEKHAEYWSKMEQEWCQEAGVKFVNIPCNNKNPPTDEQVDDFITLMRDSASHPVLLHCKLGRQRTGLMAAVYRMACENWTLEQAYEEMDRFDFQPQRRKHQGLFAILECTAKRLGK